MRSRQECYRYVWHTLVMNACMCATMAIIVCRNLVWMGASFLNGVVRGAVMDKWILRVVVQWIAAASFMCPTVEIIEYRHLIAIVHLFENGAGVVLAMASLCVRWVYRSALLMAYSSSLI